MATVVVMSQCCLCFVRPCATYLPRRWKSFRREPPSCPRAAGKPWLLRDLGQMLPRKRQKRRNLVDFCADPGRKWPWGHGTQRKLYKFIPSIWYHETAPLTCGFAKPAEWKLTHIHAHSSLGECLSRKWFSKKKGFRVVDAWCIQLS